MTTQEIRLRIAQGEDSRTQFKRGPIGVSKLAAELAAFSNAEGGDIEKIKASRATLTRAIVALQAAHKIEFRGASKNGGYHCI